MADTTLRTEVPAVAGLSNNYSAGGMTFLQMLRRLRQECGVSGSDPSSVLSLPAEMARLANYIKAAWLDIQTMHEDWEFMKQPVSFVAQAGQQQYNSIEMQVQSFGNYKLDSFSIYPDGSRSQEQDLLYLDFDRFRRLYMYGSGADQQGRPMYFSLNGQKDFLLGPTPDAQYRINGLGWAMPTELQNDTDRPSCPGQFHLAIVYRAMMMYGDYEGAPEVVQHGALEFNKLIARLAANQLPQLTFGAPLA
jgi:hypothetical protein